MGYRVGSTTLRPLELGDRELVEGEGNGENVRLALMYEEFQGGIVMGGVPSKSKIERGRLCLTEWDLHKITG